MTTAASLLSSSFLSVFTMTSFCLSDTVVISQFDLLGDTEFCERQVLSVSMSTQKNALCSPSCYSFLYAILLPYHRYYHLVVHLEPHFFAVMKLLDLLISISIKIEPPLSKFVCLFYFLLSTPPLARNLLFPSYRFFFKYLF